MQLKPTVNHDDHITGNIHSNLEIVEFGDYQCPYCGAAYPILKKLLNDFGSQIKFVFRNFPLSEMHPLAKMAAQAAESAGYQGKFWEMHDAIYENQKSLQATFFLTLADELELDIEKFKLDFNSENILQKIEEDFDSGVRSGVNGTPSFYINGKKFNGGAEDLFQLILSNAHEIA